MAPAKPKKKKKVGLFASKPKGSSGGDPAFGRLSVGGLIAVVIFVVRLLAAGSLFGLSSRSEVESYAQRDLAAANEMRVAFSTIRDEVSARAAVPGITAILDRMIADGRRVRDKKARMTDINSVKEQYQAQQDAAWQMVANETQRVGSIPGGPEALRSLQGKFQELAALLQADGTAQPGRAGLNF